MASAAPEKAPLAVRSIETSKLIVRQPAKLAELGKLLETFENLNARVSERTGEDISGDMGGGGMAAGSGQQGDDTAVSPRDQAIERMPDSPIILRQKLEGHIQAEVRKLEKLAASMGRSHTPGSAHKMNDVYARIRRLNALFYELLEASMDVLRRFFIRVFIDQQPIL